MDTTKQRLFLLDGMALVYRAHYALIRSPRYTSRGFCTSAIFGMVNTVFDILKRETPTHIATAFDTPEPTHRHREFEPYKAQREAMPEHLRDRLETLESGVNVRIRQGGGNKLFPKPKRRLDPKIDDRLL